MLFPLSASAFFSWLQKLKEKERREEGRRGKRRERKEEGEKRGREHTSIHRPRRNTVYADAFADEFFGQSTREMLYCSLRSRISSIKASESANEGCHDSDDLPAISDVESTRFEDQECGFGIHAFNNVSLRSEVVG